MDKKLNGVMPIGAPWGGPESITFLSSLASLIMYLKQYDENTLLFCSNGTGTCSEDCNRCTTNDMQKNHEALYHYLLTISGLGVGVLHNRGFECDHNHLVDILYPDYVEFTLKFLGYSYQKVHVADGKAAMMEKIKNSIDMDTPVLVKRKLNGLWIIVTGYNRDGESLEGYHGKANEFSIADWFEICESILVFDKTTKPEQSVQDAIRRMAQILDETEKNGDDIAFAHHLQSNDNFISVSRKNLLRYYEYTASMIGYYAESRSFTRNALCNAFLGRYLNISHSPDSNCGDTLSLNEALLSAAKYFQHSHDVSALGAWNAMKYHFSKPDDETLEQFREHDVREVVADYLLKIAENDRLALKELRTLIVCKI